MTYARKLVYHYPNSKEFTLKLGYRLPLSTLQEDLPFLVTLNNAQSVEFHTDCGEIWYCDKICVTKVRCKKPPRIANPNSKTKMQKRAEAIKKHKESMERCIDFLRNLQEGILKDLPPSKYHFWLGENV